MATPDTPEAVVVPPQVEQAAATAHGFITQVEHFIGAAKDELRKFLPASVVDSIEATAEQAARDAISGK